MKPPRFSDPPSNFFFLTKMFFFLLGHTNDFTDLPWHALLCRKNRGLLHIMEHEPDPLAQPRSTEATFVAGMESAHAEEMLQATAPPL